MVTVIQDLFHVRDEKTSGTSGGSPSAGDNVRDLNVVLTNEIAGASLATNQITLDAGTYWINATSPAWRCDGHRAWLYNVTDAAIEVLGTTEFSENGSSGQHQAHTYVRGRFTIAGTKTFELRHNISATTGGSQGMGVETDDGRIEVYADVQIRKIVDDLDLLHIQDQKSTNVAGGGSTGGTWHARDLNTVLTNEIAGASLATDQITLAAGTYWIDGISHCFRGDRHSLVLYNTTDAAQAVLGASVSAREANFQQSVAFVLGRFTIVAEKVFEIQHWIDTTRSTNGLGVANNDGNDEVYTDVFIQLIPD